MDHPLTLLARAFDTKGYPDDKNPDHWKTINHAPTHIDENGNIDGGAGGKFHGKPWTSTKHPHKPESYPKDPLQGLSEATKPAVTSEDLEAAWAKVVKYKVAMNQSKSEKTYQKHSQNLLNAIDKYKELYNEAGPDVAKKKHNAEAMVNHANKPWGELPKNQPAQDPLASLNNAISTPSPAPAPTNPNAPNGAYTPNPIFAVDTPVESYISYAQGMKKMIGWVDGGIADSGDYAGIKATLDENVNATNYDKFTLEEKKKIWKAFGGKQQYLDLVKHAQDIVGGHFKTNGAPSVSNPIATLASATGKQGMEAFPNGLVSAGMKKIFKTVDAAKIAGVKNMQASENSQKLYQKLGQNFGKVWKKATVAEKEAAYVYTGNFSPFNEPLRGIEYFGSYKGVGKVDFNNIYSKPDQKQKIEALTNLIDKCETVEDRVLHRGLSFKGMDKAFNIPMGILQSGDEKKLKAALEGMEWTDHGFMSCGADTNSGFKPDDIDMEIFAPKGTKGAYLEPISKYGEKKGMLWNGETTPGYTPKYENELLLQRGTRFKIMSVSYEGGKVKLQMQIISQDPYKLP